MRSTTRHLPLPVGQNNPGSFFINFNCPEPGSSRGPSMIRKGMSATGAGLAQGLGPLCQLKLIKKLKFLNRIACFCWQFQHLINVFKSDGPVALVFLSKTASWVRPSLLFLSKTNVLHTQPLVLLRKTSTWACRYLILLNKIKGLVSSDLKTFIKCWNCR